MTILLLALPWLLPLAALPILARRRHRLRDYPPRGADFVPSVTAIVPARNEVSNIGACAATLLDSEYRALDVVVVDDRSADGTLEVAKALAERSHGRLRVVHGEPLPDGWVGKPWACWQGFQVADGDLLLFTDADTRHDASLLGHAVAAMRREHADLVSVVPRQLLLTFWERLVMPQILTVITSRYLDGRRVSDARNPRDVIANGQFILVSRDAYEAVGGHEAVRCEVVEDLRLAQRFAEAGKRLFLAYAPDLMQTRMYRSLREIVRGWTKNLALGSRATVDAWLRPAIPWLAAAFLVAYWFTPAVLLVLGLLGWTSGLLLSWSAVAVAASVAFWSLVNLQMHVPVGYALLYPLGALAAAALFVMSALRPERVLWRGREYRMRDGEVVATTEAQPRGRR